MIEHMKAEWNGYEHVLPDGSYINSSGSVCYIKNGKKHREDGPAIEWFNGNKEWYRNGEFHREDGPAVENVGGSKFWYMNDKLHRDGGPAMEYADGYRVWCINGEKYTKKAYEEALKIWRLNEVMK